MKLQQLLRSAAACALAAALLSPSALAAGSAGAASAKSANMVSAEAPGMVLSDSANVISAALNEVGYVEGVREYTKYGEWYELPNAFWCDMFVSWCASQGGVPEAEFPWNCSCTKHVELFTQMGRYQNSAARGGRYIPQQGDVIFFYNNLKYPTGKVCNHTGLVLYVEDGYVYTIEGNALTNRLDYLYTDVTPEIDGDLDPPDRVVVNRYPLDALHIHGYGVPAYGARTPLALEGFVDLGQHAGDAGIFQYLSDTGVMPATSSHTFSPDHGMTRGEFMILLKNFFDLPDGSMTAAPFEDVPLDSPCYSAVMSARAAGLVSGTDGNCFLPDIYISPNDAQTIFNRTLKYVGLEEILFSFSGGDYSYLLTPYTIRADIAKAFYTLCRQMPLSEALAGQVYLGDEECLARTLNGVCYVPVQSLQEAFPILEQLAEPAQDSYPAGGDASPEQETAETSEEIQQQAPVWETNRVFPTTAVLKYKDMVVTVNGFVHQDLLYVDLYAAASLLPTELECSEEEAAPTESPSDEEIPTGITTVVRLSK